MRIVERLAGHYETQDVEFGKVYTWRPESVVAECECGKDHTSRIREELAVELLDEEEDELLHPWRYWRTSKDTGLPF